MDIKITYLKEHPEVILTLAKIWHEVLGSIWVPDIPLNELSNGFMII
jgi:hypothetical protein